MSALPWSGHTTILASAVRTVLQTSADIPVAYAREIDVILDVTVDAASAASLTLTINGKDSVSGKYYAILSGAAVSTVSTNVYKVGIGLPATANVSANCGVPDIIQIAIAVGGASPATYSVGLNMIS